MHMCSAPGLMDLTMMLKWTPRPPIGPIRRKILVAIGWLAEFVAGRPLGAAGVPGVLDTLRVVEAPAAPPAP